MTCAATSGGCIQKDVNMKIRKTKSEDVQDLQTVLDGTELFPSEMLPDMVAGFLSDQESGDLWLTAEVDGKAVGFCYALPEQLTEATWNMLAIAVLPDFQGDGIGAGLVGAMESAIEGSDGRVLIVDTSGTDEFAETRQFYLNNSYEQEARIRDFWADGDDKVIFRKAL